MTTSNPIIYAKEILNFIDQDAVYIEDENTVFLRGRVHNIIKYPSGNYIDIYIQKGPEFFTIQQNQVAFKIALDMGIELKVKKLNAED